MRRFVTLLVLLLVSVPFGISISGCGKKTPVTFCNASSGDAGVQVGQLTTIVLQPLVFGISLNYGQIGQITPPTGTDCQNTAVTPKAYTYGSGNVSIVDINPATGAICAGTWNRNLNVIPDFTVCTAPANPNPNNSETYLVAEADGVTSNRIPVFTHPPVSSIVLGTTPSSNCTTDPTTNCCPQATVSSTAPVYNASACLSQGSTGQLVARVFSGTGTYNSTNGTTTGTLSNISCQAGNLSYAPQTAGIVTIDQNGVATALQPGSTVITATIANAGSSAGFFSTCPPVNIALNVPNTTTGTANITVNQNFAQPLVATVTDQNNTVLTGLALEYTSTTPTTIPVASTGIVTPSFPGAATITAICQPPSCNPSPFNQIGLFGNGKPVTSNPINVTTPGANSTLLYLASTQSRYLVPVDFTTSTPLGAPVQLPYVPNSMVISEDGSSIYMGSSTELMIVSATTNGLTNEIPSLPGTVLSVSPDNSTVVVSDPVRKIIYLVSIAAAASSGTASGPTATLLSQYGAVGTHAVWSPDSQTVYVTAADPTAGSPQLLVYSKFTGWNNITTQPVTPLDVAVTVPSIGAYFAGNPKTSGGPATTAVGYCAASTVSTSNGQQTVTNVFNPSADTSTASMDHIAATNDGKHMIGASVSGSTYTLTDLFVTLPTGPCPSSGAGLQFTSVPSTLPITGITPTAITGVFPSSDATTANTVAAVTYTGTGGTLPTYTPSAAGTATPGTLTNVPLTGGAIAPVAGVWSTDDLTFYVGTTGDNLVHLITRNAVGQPLTDSKTLAPNLPFCDPSTLACTAQSATPNLLVQKPRKTT